MELLERWRGGDESAATELFDRYVNRLCALARSRLSAQMQRRVEPEDVVHSAYRSFFRKAGEHYSLERTGDLWRLLAAITVNKIRGKVEFHTAQKRLIYAEESVAARSNELLRVAPEMVASDPRAEDAAMMIEELSEVLASLDATQRSMIELSLQNCSIEQIAQQVQRSQRTVRRLLQSVREDLEVRLKQSMTG